MGDTPVCSAEQGVGPYGPLGSWRRPTPTRAPPPPRRRVRPPHVRQLRRRVGGHLGRALPAAGRAAALRAAGVRPRRAAAAGAAAARGGGADAGGGGRRRRVRGGRPHPRGGPVHVPLPRLRRAVGARGGAARRAVGVPLVRARRLPVLPLHVAQRPGARVLLLPVLGLRLPLRRASRPAGALVGPWLVPPGGTAGVSAVSGGGRTRISMLPRGLVRSRPPCGANRPPAHARLSAASPPPRSGAPSTKRSARASAPRTSAAASSGGARSGRAPSSSSSSSSSSRRRGSTRPCSWPGGTHSSLSSRRPCLRRRQCRRDPPFGVMLVARCGLCPSSEAWAGGRHALAAHATARLRVVAHTPRPCAHLCAQAPPMAGTQRCTAPRAVAAPAAARPHTLSQQCSKYIVAQMANALLPSPHSPLGCRSALADTVPAHASGGPLLCSVNLLRLVHGLSGCLRPTTCYTPFSLHT
jgi:hypothetical protein